MAGTGTSAGVTSTSYETIENLKKSVKEKFTEIRKAVEIREKLLLRQIDVIANQTQLLSLSTIENIEFIPDNEKDLLQCLRGFGKFNLDNINFTNDLYYIQEDYILPSIDHETMHKRLDIIASKIADLNNDVHDNDNDNYDDDNNEQIIVNFSTNKKLIKDNVNNINESIIHITLNEAKEIIEKTKNNNLTTIKNTIENNGNDIFNNYKDYEEDNKQQQQQELKLEMIKDNHQQQERQEYEKQKRQSFITQSSQTDKKLKNIINPNITINNCNGIINLKNISNLTINCVKQDSFNIPDNSNKQSIESDNKTDNDDDDNDSSYQRNKQQQEESTESNDDRTGGSGTEQDQEQIQQISSYNNTSSDIQSSDTTNTTKDSENNSINNCEFYDRLISEIKHTIKQSQKAPVEHIPLGRKAFKEKFGGGGRGGGSCCGGHGGVAINDNYSNLATALSSSDSTTTNTTTTTTNDSYNRKLLLKNFENLKVVLENNENDTHPVQIEQWLTEIISETEIEPMQNTDILEHSVINSTE